MVGALLRYFRDLNAAEEDFQLVRLREYRDGRTHCCDTGNRAQNARPGMVGSLGKTLGAGTPWDRRRHGAATFGASAIHRSPTSSIRFWTSVYQAIDD
jgi:hypothetical protein